MSSRGPDRCLAERQSPARETLFDIGNDQFLLAWFSHRSDSGYVDIQAHIGVAASGTPAYSIEKIRSDRDAGMRTPEKIHGEQIRMAQSKTAFVPIGGVVGVRERTDDIVDEP